MEPARARAVAAERGPGPGAQAPLTILVQCGESQRWVHQCLRMRFVSPSQMAEVTAALLERGYAKADVRAIPGERFLRVARKSGADRRAAREVVTSTSVGGGVLGERAERPPLGAAIKLVRLDVLMRHATRIAHESGDERS